MHAIAEELNRNLHGTVVAHLLSEVGKRIFFPKGIVAQAAEATRANVKYNATQGIATINGTPYALPSVMRYYNELSSAEIASYAPTGGIAPLRQYWKEELLRKNELLADPFSMPIVTGGITNGIALVAELFANEGDTLVTPAPYWGNYRLIFNERRGANIVTYPIFSSSNAYHTDMLHNILRKNTLPKLLCVFNSPHNPTGYTVSTQEAENIVTALVECADNGTQIAVLCDDAYFGFQYEENTMQQSLFAMLAHAHHNILAIKLDGVTKEEFAWGFRVGFVTFASKDLHRAHYDALEKKALGIVRSTLSNCNTAAQHIMYAALQSPTHIAEKKHFYQIISARYQEVTRVLNVYANHPHVRPLPFNSGYFVTLCCTNIDTEQLRQRLLKEDIGIVAIDDAHIRITYSTIDLKDIAHVFGKVFECAESVQ